MDKIKVMTVFGTRPEAIKMAPLVKVLEKRAEFDSIVCVTAQHRQMLDQVLDFFNIKADYDLDIMKSGQTLSDITARVMKGIEETIKVAKPDIVLVHGDTTTTFAGALASFYCQTKIGHVEAGLRTYDKYSPFPEEMNRCLTTNLADLYFAPTNNNRDNLLKENVDEEKIFITGNTVIDAISHTVNDSYVFENEVLRNIDFENKRVILVTAHRRENLGEPMKNIFRAILNTVNSSDDIEVVYPVHLNPLVRDLAHEILGGHERIHLIEPLDVTELHNLMSRCFFVMTDSGGLQEEAPSLGKPVLVLRNETERPEAVYAGTVKIAGVNEEEITKMAKELLFDKNEYEKMSKAVNPYGDGLASERIADAILYAFGRKTQKPENFGMKN
ncbi:MAG: UDP-N-acetylglucosamine 2-epimerase (non-hydrolyzing) [Clostridia bacterium]|nr:UDP-N-acetylglucosamine 2-epimerase (non-hydrolyzing) [Clostridia bacterium]